MDTNADPSQPDTANGEVCGTNADGPSGPTLGMPWTGPCTDIPRTAATLRIPMDDGVDPFHSRLANHEPIIGGVASERNSHCAVNIAEDFLQSRLGPEDFLQSRLGRVFGVGPSRWK